jgi:hypothetical protein
MSWAEEAANKFKEQRRLEAVLAQKRIQDRQLIDACLPGLWGGLKESIKAKCIEFNRAASEDLLRFTESGTAICFLSRSDTLKELKLSLESDKRQISVSQGSEVLRPRVCADDTVILESDISVSMEEIVGYIIGTLL